VTRVARTLAGLGLGLGILAVLALLVAGPGYRFGLWPLGTGFAILRAAAYGGIAAALVSAAGLILAPFHGDRRGMFRALAGLILGLVAVGLPWSQARTARAAPPIHDVTTDPADPPAFDAILPLRAAAANPATYGGDEVAAEQRRAYPDIEPLVVDLPTDRAFALALEAARALGWRIVASEPERRRIEATDRTFWFGFTDDIVVRIGPEAAGSRIDVRSVSRVGLGDAGTNAARIRAYLDRLRAGPPAADR
jgi:uncharacterized protein (DUF1499 family)